MKHCIIAKFKSNTGESIAETLVAVLIAAFALLMLAGTINSASNMITNSKNTLKDYYAVNNCVEKRSGTGLSSDEASYYEEADGSAKFTFSVGNPAATGSKTVSIDDCGVNLYINKKFGKPVIAYGKKAESSTG